MLGQSTQSRLLFWSVGVWRGANCSYWTLASVWGCAVADSAGLPSQGVLLEKLVLSAVRAVLRETGRVPGLRLYFRISGLFRTGLLLRNRFGQPLKVFLAELELPHSYLLPIRKV